MPLPGPGTPDWFLKPQGGSSSSRVKDTNTSRKGPSYGNPTPPRDPPAVLESSWPSRGHSAQRVGPPWLALAWAQTWDLAMFPIVRFLCGSWSRGRMPSYSFCPQRGLGSGVGQAQLLAEFSFCLFGLKAEIPICIPQLRSHRLKGWGGVGTT